MSTTCEEYDITLLAKARLSRPSHKANYNKPATFKETLPGTAAFKRRLSRRIVESTRYRFEVFKLVVPPSLRTAQDAKRIKKLVTNITRLAILENSLLYRLPLYAYMLLLLISFSAGLVTLKIVPGSTWFQFFLGQIWGYLGLLFIAEIIDVFIVMVVRWWAKPARSFTDFIKVETIWPTIAVTGYTVALASLISKGMHTHPVLATALIAAIGFLVARVLSLALHVIVHQVFDRIRHCRFPRGVIVDILVRILAGTAFDRPSWGDIGSKRLLTYALEDLAETLTHDFARLFPASDFASDLWLHRFINEVATAIREKKKWVICSKPDTREHFVYFIGNFLNNFLSGNWDSFERVKPERFSEEKAWLARGAKVMGAALIAMVPVAVTFGLNKYQILPAGIFSQAFISWIAIWAILVFLSALEPDQVSDVKALLGFIKIPGLAKD